MYIQNSLSTFLTYVAINMCSSDFMSFAHFMTKLSICFLLVSVLSNRRRRRKCRVTQDRASNPRLVRKRARRQGKGGHL